MPLPTPRINESENEFIARCIVDAEIEEEYATMSQRIAVCYNQLDQKAITKSKNYDTQKYYQGYQRQLDIAERQEVRKVASYYANQYDQAIQQFIATGQTNNFQGIFKEQDIQNIYINIYVNIGLRISKWYQSNYEKYTKKADANLSDNFFAGKFKYISQLVGAGRVRSVAQNKLQTLDRVLKKLMADPDFQSMNERDAQRLLRQQFKGISKYQAERIIRTESTLAANYATEQTARQMFNEQDMQKEWISGGDSRVRRLPRDKADHRTMNGKVVDADKKFEVPTRNGVEMMLYPGDPGASSFNLINCRCTVAYIPREDAQAQIDIQGFGVQDLGTLEQVGENFGVIVNPVAVAETFDKPLAEKTREQIIRERIEDMKPESWDDITKWAGSSLGEDVVLNDEILEFVNIKDYKVFVSKKTGASQNPYTKTIHFGETDWQYKERIVYHEFGHQMHDDLQVFGIYNPRTDFYDGEPKEAWSKFFEEMKDLVGANKRGAARKEAEEKIRKVIPDHRDGMRFYFVKRDLPKQFKDAYDKLGEVQFYEQWHSLADFFGGLTKNKIGWGHKNVYYKGNIGYQYAEMWAHMCEWRYGNAEFVKAAFPDVYEKAMKVMDELIEEFRKSQGY